MSIFSETLNRLLKEKQIKIFSMVKYCGLDRSTMYKILNGKRNPPSPDIYNKMTDYMRLTPAEYQELTEAWQITRTGPEIYFRRKSVENFIRSFPSALPTPPLVEFSGFDQTAERARGASSSALPSGQHVNYYLHQMLLRESVKKDGKAALFLQTDYDFLFSLLTSLKVFGQFEVQHILCLSSDTKFTDTNELYNLQCLKQLFPLYMTELTYSAWFFYDEIQSHYHNLNLFPCMILTSDSAIMCSADCQTGIYYQDMAIISMLWKIFLTCREKCTLLFEHSTIIPEACPDIFPKLFPSTYEQDTLIGIQPETCLMPFITGKLLKEVFNHNLPGAEQIFSQASAYFELDRKKIQAGQFIIYFTIQGLLQFARTGRTEEIPEIFYHALTPEQRITVLQDVLVCCRNSAYRILRNTLSVLPRNLHLFTCGGQGTLIFRNNRGTVSLMTINETELLHALRDYMENMEESCFYPPQEAVALIEDIISRLRRNSI